MGIGYDFFEFGGFLEFRGSDQRGIAMIEVAKT
jgi:hypothetical protein